VLNEPFIVVTHGNCPWCIRVKSLIKGYGKEYQEISLDDAPGLKEFFKMVGWKTVPQVFYGGYRIGGYEHTKAFFEPPGDYVELMGS